MILKYTLPFCVGISLLFVGCGQSSESEYTIQTPNQGCFTEYHNTYENGLVYLNQQANFLDYATMQGVPLCNKPNCLHNDATCSANRCVDSDTTPIIYKDYVYYFSSDIETVASSESEKDTELLVHSDCKRTSLHTGEEETFATFENLDAAGNDMFVLIDDTLYFIMGYGAYQNDSGTWMYMSGSGDQYFCSLNLDDGTFVNYGLVNDSPYAKNNVIFSGNNINAISDSVYISGIFQGKIYMYYQYVTDQQDLIDIMDAGGDYDDAPWIFENKCFDPETGEISISDLPATDTMSDDTYVYWDEDASQYAMVNETGETFQIDGMEESYHLDMVNHIIWDTTTNMMCCDIESRTTKPLSSALDELNMVTILDHTSDGMYIVQYYDSYGNIYFEQFSEEDLLMET